MRVSLIMFEKLGVSVRLCDKTYRIGLLQVVVISKVFYCKSFHSRKEWRRSIWVSEHPYNIRAIYLLHFQYDSPTDPFLLSHFPCSNQLSELTSAQFQTDSSLFLIDKNLYSALLIQPNNVWKEKKEVYYLFNPLSK